MNRSFMGFCPRTSARAGELPCPTGCNCSCPLVFPGISILLIPKPIPQPTLSLLKPQEASGQGGPAMSPSPAPAHVTWPQLLISSFFSISHLSFRSLFCQPFLSLLFQLSFFPPLNPNPQLQPPPSTWALQGVLTPQTQKVKHPPPDPPTMHRLEHNFTRSGKFSLCQCEAIPQRKPTSLRRRRTLLRMWHLRGSGSQALLRTAELINALELTCDSGRQREILKASQSIKFIPTCTMWSKPHLGFLSCAWQS